MNKTRKEFLTDSGKYISLALSSNILIGFTGGCATRQIKNPFLKKNFENKPTLKNKRVAIIGSGIAGMTTAYMLKKAGIEVTVFEANDHVGGRTSTDIYKDHKIDYGAQFISQSYETLIPLIKDLGLANQLTEVSPYGAVIKNKTPHVIKHYSSMSLLFSGILKFGEWFSDGWTASGIRSNISNLPLNDYSAWTKYDNENAVDWLSKNFSKSFVDYLIEPEISGLYFQQLENTSKAMILWNMAHAFSQGTIMALKDGIDSIPKAIASKVNVKLNSRVQEVKIRNDSVEVIANSENFEANRVIIATTAPIAKKIYSQAKPNEKLVLKSTYSSTITLTVFSENKLPNNNSLANVYGLLIPAAEREAISSITIEANKNKQKHNLQAYNIMLDGEAAIGLLQKSDSEISSILIKEAKRYLPNLLEKIKFQKVYRWKEAIPHSFIGRSHNIANYRNSWTKDQKVVLAGDFLSVPCTDGAAESGVWAANKVIESLS